MESVINADVKLYPLLVFSPNTHSVLVGMNAEAFLSAEKQYSESVVVDDTCPKGRLHGLIYMRSSGPEDPVMFPLGQSV